MYSSEYSLHLLPQKTVHEYPSAWFSPYLPQVPGPYLAGSEPPWPGSVLFPEADENPGGSRFPLQGSPPYYPEVP